MRRTNRELRINLMGSLGPLSRVPHLVRENRTASAFEPPTDIYEVEGELVVRVEIAGMSADTIEVSLDEVNSRLAIAGHRYDPAPEPWRRFYAMEIASGPFRRVVQLPKAVRAEGSRANYDNGLLVVRLPLRNPVSGKPRSVPID